MASPKSDEVCIAGRGIRTQFNQFRLRASAEDITLPVDEAFYRGLATRQVLRVAQQTVATRQVTGAAYGRYGSAFLRSLGGFKGPGPAVRGFVLEPFEMGL
jgi:hypothetical protein